MAPPPRRRVRILHPQLLLDCGVGQSKAREVPAVAAAAVVAPAAVQAAEPAAEADRPLAASGRKTGGAPKRPLPQGAAVPAARPRAPLPKSRAARAKAETEDHEEDTAILQLGTAAPTCGEAQCPTVASAGAPVGASAPRAAAAGAPAAAGLAPGATAALAAAAPAAAAPLPAGARLASAGPELRLGRERLAASDVARLEEAMFLNDSVINFFLHLLVRYIAPCVQPAQTHAFSTQFFAQLTGRGVASGEEGWENVRTWTKRVPDLLGHRCLLVPINEATPACHWWLVAVAMPGLVEPRGSGLGPPAPGRIYLLDSLPSQEPEREEFRCRVIRFLRGYLAREEEEERSRAASCGEALRLRAGPPLRRLPCEVVDAPAQENGADCGVFVLELCGELLLRGAAQGTADLARRGPHGPRGWFGQERASARRASLRAVAAALAAEAGRRGCEDVAALLGGPAGPSGEAAEPGPLLRQVRELWALPCRGEGQRLAASAL